MLERLAAVIGREGHVPQSEAEGGARRLLRAARERVVERDRLRDVDRQRAIERERDRRAVRVVIVAGVDERAHDD